MSSDVLARVNALFMKACEVGEKGQLLRTAEYYGRAADAARALGADSVVAVHLQLRQCCMLGGYAALAPDGTADARLRATCRAEYIVLFSGVIAALERRRAAGTLMEGKCTAAEEAWWSSGLMTRAFTADVDAKCCAALVGFDAFLRAANLTWLVLKNAELFAAECSPAQLQSFAQHVVHAAELMQQPRRHNNLPLNQDGAFAQGLRNFVAEAGAIRLDAHLVQLLAGAWQRLQRSGVLEARHIVYGVKNHAAGKRAFEMALTENMNAPGLRNCALDGCGSKEAHPAHFKSCAACRTVAYCSKEHQVEDWPRHKKACKAARKAAAAEEDGVGPSGA